MINWKKFLHLDEVFYSEKEFEDLTDDERKIYRKEKINELFIKPYSHFSQRNQILVGDHNTIIELSKQIDWFKFLPNYIAEHASFETLNLFDGKKLKDYQKKILPAITLKDASDNFNFPPQHPQNGYAYAACSVLENYYYPLAKFHDYVNDSKQSALVELCASLNAKEISILSYEENGKKFNGKAMLKKIPTKIGLLDVGSEIEIDKLTKEKKLVLYKFSKPEKEMEFYENPWIESVPSWSTLRKIRLERGLVSYQTQLDFSDEMGVNNKIIGSLKSIGVNIGGEYKKLKKRKYNLSITFW